MPLVESAVNDSPLLGSLGTGAVARASRDLPCCPERGRGEFVTESKRGVSQGALRLQRKTLVLLAAILGERRKRDRVSTTERASGSVFDSESAALLHTTAGVWQHSSRRRRLIPFLSRPCWPTAFLYCLNTNPRPTYHSAICPSRVRHRPNGPTLSMRRRGCEHAQPPTRNLLLHIRACPTCSWSGQLLTLHMPPSSWSETDPAGPLAPTLPAAAAAAADSTARPARSNAPQASHTVSAKQ